MPAQPEHFVTMELEASALRTRDRLDGRNALSIARIIITDRKTVNVWITGQGPHAQPWRIYGAGDTVRITRPIPDVPVLTGPGMPDPESRVTGPISVVTVDGPWDAPVFEIGRWDNNEGEFVHVVTLSREEADALHTALGRTLLG